MLFSRSSGDVSNHLHVDAPTQKAEAPNRTVAGKEQALTRIDKGRSTSSVIDEWLSITGNLETDGDVLVNGKIHGDIHCKLLIVGEQAHVEGLIVADEVVVRGAARGVIRANRVRIEKSSRVDSEVFHRAICVEEGAEFVGRSRRSDDPINDLATDGAKAAELRKTAAEMKAIDEPAGRAKDEGSAGTAAA